MKKLLVLLALLLGTVSVYAAGPTPYGGWTPSVSTTGDIYGHLTCPLTITRTGEIKFAAPAMAAAETNVTTNNTMNFDILTTCMQNDPSGGQNPLTATIHADIKMEINPVGTTNTALNCEWRFDYPDLPITYTMVVPAGAGKSLTENKAMWAATPLLLTLTKVNTTAQPWQATDLHWIVTVTATPTDF